MLNFFFKKKNQILLDDNDDNNNNKVSLVVQSLIVIQWLRIDFRILLHSQIDFIFILQFSDCYANYYKWVTHLIFLLMIIWWLIVIITWSRDLYWTFRTQWVPIAMVKSDCLNSWVLNLKRHILRETVSI